MYWICYTAGGKQRHESTGTHDRKLAKKILAIRLAEIAEGKWNLPASNPPRFKDWTTQFLLSIRHPSTQTRYQLSVNQLLNSSVKMRGSLMLLPFGGLKNLRRNDWRQE
jgi:hypothetical protein